MQKGNLLPKTFRKNRNNTEVIDSINIHVNNIHHFLRA